MDGPANLLTQTDGELNPALVCTLYVQYRGLIVREGESVDCWAASKPNSTLHFDTFQLTRIKDGWKEKEDDFHCATTTSPTLHDRTGLQPPLPPPPLHLSSPLRLHPSFSLSVHLVCLTKSSGWKTLTCVRLCYLNTNTHGN